jgi:hypothetical protein
MSSTTKICPECQLTNAAMNLACLRCQQSLMDVPFAESWTDKYKDQGFERNYFLEELFSPTFLVCIPAAIFFATLAIFSMGSFITPIAFLVAVICAGVPFMPGDPVGAYIRMRLDQIYRKNQQREQEASSDGR